MRGLHCQKKFNKGQILCAEIPTASIQKLTTQNFGNLYCTCTNCNSLLNIRETQNMQSINCDLTPLCKAIFCSKFCHEIALNGSQRESSEVGWHKLTCIQVLESLCTQSYFVEQDACQLATIVLAKSIAKICSFKSDIETEKNTLSSYYFPDQFVCSSNEKLNKENLRQLQKYQTSVRILRNRAEEFRILLKQSWTLKLKISELIIQKLLEKDFFLNLVTSIQTHGRAIEIGADNVELEKLTVRPNLNYLKKQLLYSDSYSRYKKDQLVRRSDFSSFCSNFEQIKFGFFCSPFMTLINHSCCPNVQLESVHTEVGMKVKFVALCNILQDDELTISYISTKQDYLSRKHELLAHYGFLCTCCRCSWEKGGSEYTRLDLISMSRQAFDELRYKDSLALMKYACKNVTGDSEIYHVMGLNQIALGKWSKAHDSWYKPCLNPIIFESFEKQKHKDKSYNLADLPLTENRLKNRFTTLGAGGIWLLPSSALSKKSCIRWISLAEDFSRKEGGWYTQRHISVATTDLPIHCIPELLKEWNLLVTSYLIPMIRKILPDCVNRKRIRVHDAFIIKYDASKGRDHLPLHIDQSELSVTLALNSTKYFGGGGTMFPTLGITVCPNVGELLLFRGDFEHCAFPITFGIRYVIAAFLYFDNDTRNLML